MLSIVLWIVLGLCGMIVGVLGGYYAGGGIGAGMGMMAGFLCLMPLLQMISIGKQKGFLPLYVTLKEFEKHIIFPDSFGKLKTMIVNTRHEGVCYKKGLGLIDDKGTEYSWGKDPCSFGVPKLGMTVDITNASYTDLLEKNRKIEDYDNAIKEYLGEDKYKIFCEKYRKNDKPDIYAINKELDALINVENPKDSLSLKVFGETYSFKNFLRFLKYAYHPQALEVAMDQEKLWVRQEQLGYKNTDRAIGWAKAVLLVLFGLMIFFAVIGSLNIDFSNMFGMFGGK